MSKRAEALARKAEKIDVRDLTENQFQAWVTVEARKRGWRLQFHVERSYVKGRWLTNTSTPGVPDLWLCRPQTNQLVVLELKSWTGKPSDLQLEWITALQQVPGVDAFIVSPRDADEVLALLDWPDQEGQT